jgi:hypothetical protein
MRSLTLRAFGPAAVAGLVAVLLALRPGAEPAAVAQTPGGTPADLALVPADATGFVHLRLADLWKNEMFAEFRKTFEKAGPRALAALDAQFVPAPSTLDRATGFVLLDQQKGPQPFAVLAFTAAFDPDKVARTYLPGAQKRQVGGKTVYGGGHDFELHFPDTRHIMIGMPGGFEAYFSKPVAKDGPLAGAIKRAAAGTPIVAAANLAGLPIPKQLVEQLPAEARPLLKAQQLMLSVDLGPQAKVDLRATYPDAAAAADAHKAVRAMAGLARNELAKLKADLEKKLFEPKHPSPRPPEDLPEAIGSVFLLGALTRADEFLADESLVKLSGSDLAVSVALPKELTVLAGGGGAVLIGLLLPAVQKVRDAAGRTQSANNLKQIALAVHNYEATFGHLPSDIKDKTGKPILSWRVAILPFIEQQQVYQQFKLDEPWDSPNNKKWSQVRIPTFMTPADSPVAVAADSYGMTNYLGVSGPGTIFDPKGKIRIVDIADGTSNTILAVETLDAVPWAKPGDLVYDPAKPLPKITPAWPGDMTNVAMGDGSVRAINVKRIPEKTLRALFTRAGGEVIDPKDW